MGKVEGNVTSAGSQITEEHLVFLDNLKESGATNMWGAGTYVEEEFDVGRREANDIVGYWMKTFGERHGT